MRPWSHGGGADLFGRVVRLVAITMLMWSLGARADDLSAYQSLLDNSPFLTQAFRNQLGRRDRTAVRFLGYTRIEQEWFFALHDSKADKAYWLKLEQEEDSIRVERFNRKAERLHVNVDGISFELGLQDQ